MKFRGLNSISIWHHTHVRGEPGAGAQRNGARNVNVLENFRAQFLAEITVSPKPTDERVKTKCFIIHYVRPI